MKKIALASAVALASVTAAHAAPTVYGKIFLTGDYVDTNYDSNYKVNTGTTAAPNWRTPKDDTSFRLNSNASRVGFKGTEPLTANTDLVYQLEYGVDVDSNSNNRANDNQQFYARNTFLGVSNKQYGTLLAGRHDTPFKLAKGDADVFNANSSTFSIDNTGPVGYTNLGEVRANNVIAYKSPKLTTFPVTFMVATSLSEVDSDADVKGTEKDEGANAYSASAVYDENGVYVGVGYDNNVGAEDQAWRIAGTVDMGKFNMVNGLKLGALYQQADLFNTNDDAKTWLISGKYKVANTPWTAKAQYISTDFANRDTSEVVVGGEYSFNKNTTGHLYGGQISRDNYKDDTIIGGGLEYKF